MWRVSLAERKKKKEKSRFLTVSGSVCRRPLWKVPLCVLVVHCISHVGNVNDS